jgi:hypothetical protein
MFCRVLPLRSTATSAEFLDVVLRCGELPRCLTVHEVEPKHKKEDIHSLQEGARWERGCARWQEGDEIVPGAEH